jgi:hypothetical protein
MTIYLINAETNEVIQTYTDVQSWGYNFVEYLNNGRRAKFYCGENEYFSEVNNAVDSE